MDDRTYNEIFSAPRYFNIIQKILEDASVQSGMIPLGPRLMRSPYGTQDGLHVEDASIQNVYNPPPILLPVKKSMGELRKERLLTKEKNVCINNNYLKNELDGDKPSEPSEPSKPSEPSEPSGLLREFIAHRSRTKLKIPEEIRYITITSTREVMSPIILDGFEPSRTCSCGGPISTVQCRMCGSQFEAVCFLHDEVGKCATKTRCRKPTCASDKLLILRDI